MHLLKVSNFWGAFQFYSLPFMSYFFILTASCPSSTSSNSTSFGFKLPATILSRCQRFDFKRISREDIMKRLSYICNENNTKIEENASIKDYKVYHQP